MSGVRSMTISNIFIFQVRVQNYTWTMAELESDLVRLLERQTDESGEMVELINNNYCSPRWAQLTWWLVSSPIKYNRDTWSSSVLSSRVSVSRNVRETRAASRGRRRLHYITFSYQGRLWLTGQTGGETLRWVVTSVVRGLMDINLINSTSPCTVFISCQWPPTYHHLQVASVASRRMEGKLTRLRWEPALW